MLVKKVIFFPAFQKLQDRHAYTGRTKLSLKNRIFVLHVKAFQRLKRVLIRDLSSNVTKRIGKGLSTIN
jgi:hypothetical protein